MKQVIVVRKDLNCRKGKMMAQAAHASLGAYLNALDKNTKEWFETGQTKICVGVDSEADLLAIYEKAKNAGLPCALILDAAHTEFKEPTYTAVGIGPFPISMIDPITGHLKLL